MNLWDKLSLVANIIAALAQVRNTPKGQDVTETCWIGYTYKGERYAITGITARKV